MNTNNMIDNIAELSQQNMEDGDYIGEDGLLYCGKCHTPKQCIITWFDGNKRKVGCRCKCEAEKKEKEKQEFERQQRMLRINEYRSAGFKDAELAKCRFENDDKANEKVTKIAKNYASHFGEFRAEGKGLLLFGGVGTGKTFMASCIANAVIDQDKPVLVTNFARIINTMQESFDGRQRFLDGLNDYELMVIDDLATERNTEYVNEIIYNVIDSRYRSGKPLIVTTNLPYSAIENPEGMDRQRIYSRIIEMCIPVPVSGEDRRKKKKISENLIKLLNS